MPRSPESSDTLDAYLQIRIRPPLLHLTKAVAARQSVTMSELTRRLLREEAHRELGIQTDDAA